MSYNNISSENNNPFKLTESMENNKIRPNILLNDGDREGEREERRKGENEING